MSISIVIPWCDRPELATTLHRTASLLDKPGLELICVNMGGDFALMRACMPPTLPRWTCIDAGGAHFNKARCMNVGLALSKSDSVLFLDADVVLLDDVLLRDGPCDATVYVLGDVSESVNESIAPLLGNVRRVDHHVTFHLRGARKITIQTNSLDFDRQTRSAPGIMKTARKSLAAVGGLNGHLDGWGWEDLDLLCRLIYKEDCIVVPVSSGVHLSHSNRGRHIVSTKADDEMNNYMTSLLSFMNDEWYGTLDEDSTIPVNIERCG